MPRYDFISQRLFVQDDLKAGTMLDVDRGQSNYLVNVLRLKDDAPLLVFNGRDGEWQARLRQLGRKKAALEVVSLTRPQTPAYDLHYLFAPLKQARLEYMVQKAVEMGVGVLQPVLTQYTQTRKLNLERMSAHAIEAAEQCGILNLPKINSPLGLEELLADLPTERRLIFCDEGEATQNPLTPLEGVEKGPLSVLVGPEGGFSEDERALLHSHANVTPIPLGPRVLRADTAAVAALAIIQASIGDWHD
ncbi:MAG: 16S rRNA (uracil(1498)-N(3))-methyltransferase [Rhizobiaceae bacterium]